MLDEVFLVGALVGEQDESPCRLALVVRDVEEVPDIGNQGGLAALDRQVLTLHDYAVALATHPGAVLKLRDMLRLQSDVLIAALLDDGLFDVFAS